MTRPERRQSLARDARRIPVPAAALDAWLAEIDDLAELKLTLRVLGLLSVQTIRRDSPPSISIDDLLDDLMLRRSAQLGDDVNIRAALAASLNRGTLAGLRIGGENRVFLNDDRTQEYLARLGIAALKPSDISEAVRQDTYGGDIRAQDPPQRPTANIFALYEEHIGAYGHGMAEQLKAAEEEYPPGWIAEAFAIAAEQNVRSWGYVHAILRRWLQEGKPAAASTTTQRYRDRKHDHGEPGYNPEADSRTGYLDSYRRRHGRLPWESNDTPDGTGG